MMRTSIALAIFVFATPALAAEVLPLMGNEGQVAFQMPVPTSVKTASGARDDIEITTGSLTECAEPGCIHKGKASKVVASDAVSP